MAKIGCLKPFRGTGTTFNNTILEDGEIAFDITNKRIYMGNGTNSISGLNPFINNGSTDISSIGDGSITGAINTINNNIDTRGKWYTGAVVGTKTFAQLAQEIIQAGVNISLALPSLMDQLITNGNTVSPGVASYACNYVGRNITVLVTTWNSGTNMNTLFSLVDFFEFSDTSSDAKGIPIIVKYYSSIDSRNGIYVF